VPESDLTRLSNVITDRAVHAWTSPLAAARVVGGLLVTVVLAYAYALRIFVGDGNPFNYFGYFTNQTSLLAGLVLIATGVLTLTGRPAPAALDLARGITTSYLLIVAVVYNVLVPGTGSAPPWISVLLHVIFPALVALDWLLIGDRPRLPWRTLWLVLPYPVLWLTTVLLRGATDGWVPYGFLLPERGLGSLVTHIVGLLAALILAGCVVWLASRFRGLLTAAVTDRGASALT
jgi:hypothetical protein